MLHNQMVVNRTARQTVGMADGTSDPASSPPAPGLGALNLLLAFLLELALLAALAVWGFALPGPTWLRWVAGLGAPVLVVLVWGAWLAPRSPRRLRMPGLVVVKLALYLLAALALVGAGHALWGIALLALAVLNLALAMAWRQDGVV